jgi:hypothetical protein
LGIFYIIIILAGPSNLGAIGSKEIIAENLTYSFTLTNSTRSRIVDRGEERQMREIDTYGIHSTVY